jgi:hypothetical protein
MRAGQGKWTDDQEGEGKNGRRKGVRKKKK